MISGQQVRAARALLGIDQKQLASLAGLSLPTVQRMEASPGSVRVVVDSLEKVLQAFALAGVELIPDGSPSYGRGCGVRLIGRMQKPLPDRDTDRPRPDTAGDVGTIPIAGPARNVPERAI